MSTSATLAWLGFGPAGGIFVGSQAHRKANDFTTKYQNQFGKDISGILDPVYASVNGKTLTLDQATSALDAFNKRVAQFDADAANFSTKGNQYMQVVNQAYTGNGKDDPGLTKRINDWRSYLQNQVDTLSASTGNEPPAPPTMDSVVGGGRTAKQQIDLAARLARENAIAGGGLRTTLLGGGADKGLTTRPRSLLGY